jgi:hypothetical protein
MPFCLSALNARAQQFLPGQFGVAAMRFLSNIAREAPLGSLLIAFLLGVAVARRR